MDDTLPDRRNPLHLLKEALKEPAAPASPAQWIEKEHLPRVGPYVLRNQLGAGGMGDVFRAWQPSLSRWVALKFLRDARNPESHAWFQREARLAAGLDHPNVAKIFEIGEHENLPYIAMQFVDGESLAFLAPATPLDRKLDIVRDVAEAIRYAHDRKVIHRDLKPANVMVDREGHVYVMDFGLAKETEVDGASLTATGAVMGTPSYMAPEQARGQADGRSDLYGIGAILYQLVTGRPPFVGDVTADVLAQVVRDEPIRPRRLAPDLADDVEAIVLKCLERDRSRRYASAAQIIEDLDAYRNRNPLVHARRPTMAYLLARRIRKQPLLWAFGTALVAAILGGAAFGTYGLVRAKRQALRTAAAEREGREKEAAQRRKAVERLSYAYYLRAREADEAGEPAEAALLACEAYALGPSALTRAAAVCAAARLARLRRILAHEGEVTCVVLSPDGSAAATLSQGTFRLWTEGVSSLRGPRSDLLPSALARRADGTWIVGSLEGKVLTLRDGRTGEAIGRPITLEGAPSRIVLDSAGKHVAAVFETMIEVWDIDAARRIGRLVHPARVLAAEFGADGRFLASAAEDRLARVWSVATGVAVAKAAHIENAIALAFSPDGALLATGCRDGSARLWDARTGAERGRPMKHAGAVHLVAFTPDGRRLATVSDRHAFLWDVGSGDSEFVSLGHNGEIESVSFSADGRRAVTAAIDWSARIWEVDRGAAKRLALGAPVWAMAASPDRLFAATREGKAVLWSPADGTTKPIEGRILTGAFDRDGRLLATVAGDGSARLRDGSSGTPVGDPIREAGAIRSLGFAPDGRLLLVAEKSAQVWDVSRREAVGRPMTCEDWIMASAVSPDGRRIAIGSTDGIVRVWDAATGEPIGKPMKHALTITAVAFSPDGRRVATGSADVEARLWDSETGEPVGSPMRHDGGINAIGFRPGGTLVATASLDGTARVWDARTGAPIGKILRHSTWVSDLRWSPSGRYLASADADGIVRLWDAETGDPVGPRFRAGAGARGVLFVGHFLFFASDDGFVRSWDLAFLADESSPEVLRRRVQRDTALRLDERDEVRPMLPEEWRPD